MKIMVSGSRSIISAAEVLVALQDAFTELKIKLDPHEDYLLCGMAHGVDMLAKSIFEEMGIRVIPFPAEWSKDAKRAGVLRSQEMVKQADVAIFIWDGISRGTSHAIRAAEQKPGGIKMYIHKLPAAQPQEA